MKNTRYLWTLFFMLVFVSVVCPAEALITFTIDNSNAQRGTMSISASTMGNSVLNNPSSLTTGSNTYQYATVFFQPSTTARYKFGQSSGPTDTVMIIYSGLFNPLAPGIGAMVGNDDTNGLMPEVQLNVMSGTTYTLLVSTYSPGDDPGLPLSFYSNGSGSFSAAPPAAVPAAGPTPAASPLVFGSCVDNTNNIAQGAATIIDNTPVLLALFSGLDSNGRSNAATQTLPLMASASTATARSASTSAGNIVQARSSDNRGMSSGNIFHGNKNVWLKTFGSHSRQSDIDNVPGFTDKTGGMVMGIDHEFPKTLKLGIAFASAKSFVDGGTDVAPQSSDVTSYQAIVYGSYNIDARTFLDFQVAAGRNLNNMERKIAFQNSIAHAEYETFTTRVGLGISRSYRLGNKIKLLPSLSADYITIVEDEYTETDAGLLNLSVQKRRTNELIFGVGGKLEYALKENTSLFGEIGINSFYLAERAVSVASFAGASNTPFTTYGTEPSKWMGRTGVGIAHKLGKLEIVGRYDTGFYAGFLSNSIALDLRWAF